MFTKMIGYIQPMLGVKLGVNGKFGNIDAAKAAAITLHKEGHIDAEEMNAVATILLNTVLVNASQCAQKMDGVAKCHDGSLWKHAKRGARVGQEIDDLGA